MTKDTSKLPDHNIEEDEIDLIALAKTLWNGRKTVIKTTIIFMALGLFIAIFSQKEYTASTTFISQVSDKKIGGSLGGLAAMAGINLGSIGGDSGISPTLYPQILNSIPFQRDLLQTPLKIKGQKEPVSFSEYYSSIHKKGVLSYLKKYTIGLPGILTKVIKGDVETKSPVILNDDIFYISEKEKNLIEILSSKINIDVNEEEGFVTIVSNMPEAIASAQLTKEAQNLLQQYVLNFKIQKSSEQLKFVEERYFEKEKLFKEVQNRLAYFRDKNQFINSAVAQTRLERLQSEYDLAFSVYVELAKQLETQKIQVKENTPVFTIVKPVFVPVEKSKPKRMKILILWTFIGFVIGVGLVLGKEFFFNLIYDWNK